MTSTQHPFWTEGLRPFFLLGAAFAAASIPLWVLMVSGAVNLPMRGGMLAWHAHESLFGFLAAAVAGFLTTAVPQWTGQPPLKGMPLALLVLMWLAGRFGLMFSASLPGWLVAAIDVAFLPVLCLALVPAILRARQWRNLPVIALVFILATANLLMHLALMGIWPNGAAAGSRLGLMAIIVLVSIIGGRIVPTFTRNALVRTGHPVEIPPRPGLAIAGNVSAALAGLLIVMGALPTVTGIVALAAATLAAFRLASWHGWAAWRIPLLWVLHLGYLWVPIGLALYGLTLLGAGVTEGAAIHALSVGAAATMVLAVTSRASLGHTGRPLTAPGPMVIAYLLLTASALARVAAAMDFGGYTPLLHTAAVFWTGAFAIFFIVYLPILTRARLDAGY